MNEIEREQLRTIGEVISKASEQIEGYERAISIIRNAIWLRGGSAPQWALDALERAEKEILK
jgi:hypothetical protein